MRTVSHIHFLGEGLTTHCSQIVKAQFDDPELQDALKGALQWQQKSPIRYIFQLLIMTNSAMMRLELVPLLLSILKAPSILPGTGSPETISIACAIIRNCDSRRNELRCWHLLLLGIALHNRSCVNGNFSQHMSH